MFLAGQVLTADDLNALIPEKIGEETADSADFTTTQTVVMTGVASVVQGRTYRIRFIGRWAADAASNIITRIREDTGGGAEVAVGQVVISDASSLGYGPQPMSGEFVAGATGDKTFVITGVRNGAGGNCRLEATNAAPARMYAELVE